MLVKKTITILAIAAQLCFSLELEPIAKYEGHHSNKYLELCQQKMTGVLVNDKVYTFGGSFPIPYMVDPAHDIGSYSVSPEKKFNMTDEVYSYNILQDTWKLETHMPFPFCSAKLQVVNNAVYLFDINTQPDTKRSTMWKYETDTNTWRVLERIPFIWRNKLLSCEHDDLIYFTGSQDSQLRTIIQRYDTRQDTWSSPLFLDSPEQKTLYLENMFCFKDSLHFLGRGEVNQWKDTVSFIYNKGRPFSFYTWPYDANANIEDTDFNVTLTREVAIESRGDWLYMFDVLKKNSTLSKANPFTKQVVQLGSVDQVLQSTLFVPYNDEVAILLGGASKNFLMDSTSEDELGTYNHKVKFNTEEVSTITNNDEEQIIIIN